MKLPSQCGHGHLVAKTEVPAVRAVVVGRHRGFHEHTETQRLRVLVKTAVSPDEPFTNGRDPGLLDSAQRSRPTVEPVRST